MKIVILGAGKLGSSIAQALLIANHEITIVDNNPAVIDRLSSRMDLQTVCTNAKDIEGLKSLNIDKCDVVIACTDNDEKNMVLCVLAKDLGAKRCIARVRSSEHVEHLSTLKRAMRIDHIVNPDYSCAVEVYKHITNHTGIKGGLQMIDGVALAEFTASSLKGFAGGALRDRCQLLDGLLAAAISRNGKLIIPGGNTEILADDKVYVLGQRETALQLLRKLDDKNADEQGNNVMIAGGGKTGYFIAKLLGDDGVKVTVIENDFDRGKHLAVVLDKANIVYGDATDQELLNEEGFTNMDAFIACTGFDEENILLALMANKQGVKNVVAKMSRRVYGSIIDNLGDAMTINPIELCTANVIKFINDDKNVKFSRLIQGQAEFSEIVVKDNMPVAGKKLSELNLGEGLLVGAINRRGELIIPNGTTMIKSGDKLTILAMLSKVPEIEKLINNANSGEF